MTKSTRNILLRRMRRVLLVLMLCFLIFALFFNNYIKDQLTEDAKSDLLGQAVTISKEVDGYFIQYREVVKQMRTNDLYLDFVASVDNPNVILENHPDLHKVMTALNRIQETDEEISYVWLGLDRQNTLVTHNPEWQAPESFEMSIRPWFVKMQENDGQLSFSDPYIGAGTNKHIMSIVAPLEAGDKRIGSVGIDIDIESINNFVDTYKIGKAGYAFLLSDRGELVVSYDTHRSIGEEVLKLKDQILAVNGSDIIEYEFDDQHRYMAFAKVPSNGWIVGSVLPKSETQGLINLFNGMSTMVIVAAALIMLIFEFILRLSTDLENLNKLYGTLQEQEEQIKQIAYVDPLTEIPNRRNFIERLEASIEKGEKGAVLLLDIDNFKEINDTFGHMYGDDVLKEVARLLKTLENEDVFISRFGGDEFLIQLNGHESYETIESHIEQVVELFNKHVIVAEEEFFLSVSMGVTLYPQDSFSVKELIINADLSMYDVKNNGKASYAYFHKSMTNRMKEKAYIEKELRKALKEKSFALVYQPQVSGTTGEVTSFEALLRMTSASISPSRFIPVAEDTGLIIEIGRRVTLEVVKHLAYLKASGQGLKPIAINFSVKQLKDETYIDYLSQLLNKYGVSPTYIEIEITESIMMDNEGETLEFLKGLKDLGVSLSLDDFGTGYTSLNYLTFLPVDKIKIDKSLSDKFLLDKDISVMDNLIALAHSLNLKVVAEGIEEYEQFQQLKAYHCDYIQGYYFSKPCDDQAMILLLNRIFDVK